MNSLVDMRVELVAQTVIHVKIDSALPLDFVKEVTRTSFAVECNILAHTKAGKKLVVRVEV